MRVTKLAVTMGLLLGTLASAQQSAPPSDAKPEPQAPNLVRIGVPIMGNTSTRSVNRKLQRDWLVLAFQPEKKKKKAKQQQTPRIEAVALDSDSPAAAAREARDKNCDYVLYTTLVELREPGDPQRRNQPGSISIGRDPLGAYPDPSVMHDPVHYAVVEYRLQGVSEPEARLALSVSGEEHTDEDGTVQRLLFLIVSRVKDELREPSNSGPN